MKNDENLYKVESILSLSKKETGFKERISEIVLSKLDKGSIICWLNHTLLFGIIKEGNIRIYPKDLPIFEKHLIRLRAFNEMEELYIWKDCNDFHYRYRIDKDHTGQEQDFIEAHQILLGTKITPLENEFSKVSEKRGVQFIIPSKWLSNKQIDNNHKIVLNTRNYIVYNDIGQASFFDSRFLSIGLEEVELNEE